MLSWPALLRHYDGLESTNNIATFAQFRSIACVVMGCLAGVLIAAPFTTTGAGWLLPVFGVLGAGTGYRRRHSAAFLYFCLVSILVLSMLVTSHTTR
jgi:hypothetical protein